MKKTIIILVAVKLFVLMPGGCSLSCEDAYETVITENGDDNHTEETNDTAEPEENDDTGSEIVDIKDPELEHALREILEKPDGEITQKDMRNPEEADLSNRGIASVSGLEYAVNLVYLNLRGNNISDLSPLANLKSLERLILDKNKISDITALDGLTGLKALELKENRIEDISTVNWDNMHSLSFLDLRYNFIDVEDPAAKHLIDTLYDSGVAVWHDQPQQLFDDW